MNGVVRKVYSDGSGVIAGAVRHQTRYFQGVGKTVIAREWVSYEGTFTMDSGRGGVEVFGVKSVSFRSLKSLIESFKRK